jgi:voltage-gated potassium channel
LKALRNIKLIAAALAALIVAGTAGYHFVEGWSWFDGLYMVVITISTIGYNEVHPLSHGGRVLTIVVIACGVGLLALLFGSLTQALLELELGKYFGRRRMQHDIERLRNHFIICGAGRVGRSVARELKRRGVNFVIVEARQERFDLYSSEWLMMIGDASKEDVLRAAQIEHAAGLVAATTGDATNIYIVLTARALNPRLKIIARASEEAAEKHLRKAGADQVVSPYSFAGHRIALSFLRPNVVDFLDVATASGGKLDLEIEEVRIAATSAIAGKTLADSRIRQDTGVIVLAIQRDSGARFNPSQEDKLAPNDCLIVMGNPTALKRLEEMAGSRK